MILEAQPAAASRPDGATIKRIERVRLFACAFVGTLIAIVLGGILAGWRLHDAQIAMLFVVRQDMPLLPLLALPLLSRFSARVPPRGVASDHRLACAAAVAILLLPAVCWIGHRALLQGWSLSRDEQMADFDASVFGSGRLFATIPSSWRDHAAALNQTFMLPIGDRYGWLSAYLPVNAAFRAIVGTVDPTLASPLLVAIGGVALWRIARRLWPASPGSRAVVLILYAGSSQVLFMGMTAYAMSGHLALNLLWLLAFLRDDRRGHGAAVAIGVLATGMHQPVFHPLFVLPFLLMLAERRRFRLLAFYAVAYAAIGLSWLAWPGWVSGHGPAAPAITAGAGFVARMPHDVGRIDAGTIWLMAANLLRFVAWQHLLLLPLLALGVAGGWRRDPLVRALTIGLVLPVAVMTVLLPSQGHGWGYRYLHGLIGNACLLGAFGWHWLEERGRAPHRALALASAATFAVLIPIHGWMARETVLPAAALDRRIAATDAALVIVDDDGAPFAADVVLNRPDLDNRPLRLLGSELKPTDAPGLCRRGAIAFVDAPALAGLAMLYGLPAPAAATPHQRGLEAAAGAAGCPVRGVGVPAGG